MDREPLIHDDTEPSRPGRALKESHAAETAGAGSVSSANVCTVRPDPVPPIPRLTAKSAAEAIFDMVVALMWSDGGLSDEEVQRGRAVAHALHVGPLAGGVFGAMAEGPLPFNELGFDALGDVERQTAYALSAWTAAPELATADRYRGFLHALGMRLALTAEQVTRLLALALAIDERKLPPSQAAPELVRAVASGV